MFFSFICNKQDIRQIEWEVDDDISKKHRDGDKNNQVKIPENRQVETPEKLQKKKKTQHSKLH